MQDTKILLLEDDENLGQILKEYLDVKGFQTTLCRDGKSGLQTFRNGKFDLCIFDVMMPIMDGFTVAEEIRKTDKQTPIMFLTAKSMKEDTINGFKAGADDYLTKPFSMEELRLRIDAILRRTKNQLNGQQNVPALKSYNLGHFKFDYDLQTLKSANEEYHLTSKEADLLQMLCESKNQILERSIALKKIWLDDNYFNSRSMDVYITKLRKYIKSDDRLQIINVHGTGFKLIEITDNKVSL
jgi:DNA-binding response OmpR family regulator